METNESLCVGERVRIYGFTSDPRAKYNNLLATVKACDDSKDKLLLQLDCDDGLVLMKKHHVTSRIDSLVRPPATTTTATFNIHRVDTCAICLSLLANTPRVQTYCAHVFHTTCLQQWIEENNGVAPCPLCRHPVHAAKPHALMVGSVQAICQKHAIDCRFVVYSNSS